MGGDRFLQACARRPTDRTPVWFMRQAGRYMDDYRKIREKFGLLEMFRTPEIAAEVTLQPIQSFKMDAAIVFADILLPLMGMGIDLEYTDGEGPVIHNPVRDLSAALDLRVADPEEDLEYVLTTLRLVRAEIDEKIPLIGFAGAPFTLASYVIEGGTSRSHLRTKRLMYEAPEVWQPLMNKLSEGMAAYLIAQARAGAQALQIFDSWVGCLSPADYREYVLPYSRKLLLAVKDAGVPTIHFGTGNAGFLPYMKEAGGDVIGVDWRTSIDDAWSRIGYDSAIQGNLDPAALLAPRPLLEARAREVLELARGRPGHIFNLGHGILPSTPMDSVKALVDFVHEYQA